MRTWGSKATGAGPRQNSMPNIRQLQTLMVVCENFSRKASMTTPLNRQVAPRSHNLN